MSKNNNLNKRISSLLCIAGGNFLYALTVKLFLLPSGLVTGGTTGIGLTLNHYLGMSISLFVLIFNIITMILGYITLGKQFAATTLASSFLYPLSLELLNRLLGDLVITNDVILCTLFSGIGIGLSLGIVIRSGASTGGVDIPAIILNRFFHLPISITLYAFDTLIIFAQATYRPIENVLYGLIMAIIYTVVLNKTLLMGTSKIQVKIISSKHEEIKKVILSQIDRGVTLLNAEGGYTGEGTQLVLSVISNRELPQLENLIHEIDPESFIIISEIKEVSGRGFSLGRIYK